MKKMLHFSVLLGAVFLYLVYRVKLQKHDVNIIIIMEYFEGIMKIVLGICGILLTCNTIKIKINNKANFMSISGLSISVLTVLKLWFYMRYSDSIFSLDTAEKYRWVIEYLQIISLMIGVNYIKEHKSLKIWSIIYGVVCGAGMIWIWSPLGLPVKILGHEEMFWIKEVMGISCMLLVSMIYIISYKKIKALPSFERNIIHVLFGIKFLVNAFEGFHLISNQSGTYMIYQVSQIIFSVLIIAYIDELTLSIAWKKIDIGVQSKNEKAIKGHSEQRTLVTAASEIKRIIENIDRKIFNLEMQIGSDYNNQYMNYTDKIRNNCLRLLKLSTNILDLNKDETDHKTCRFELINLSGLIGDVVESVETYIMQKGVQMTYTVSDQCIMAEVDKEAIERLFLNLLSNAVKYNKVNGTIKVTLTEKKNRIYLCVQDTGIGIPNDYLNLVFEKFQRVNAGLAREQEGSGLGLAIVKSIVDVHHGEIKIISKEDRGTLISIGLPVKQGERTDQIKCKTRYKESLNTKIQLEFLGIDK